MLPARSRAWASTFTLVVGALLVGDALHGAVTTGAYGVTSPAAVVRVVGGAVLIAVGYRLRTPVSEYVATAADEADEESEEPASWDPSLSPLGDDAGTGSENAGDAGTRTDDADAAESGTDDTDDAGRTDDTTATGSDTDDDDDQSTSERDDDGRAR